MGKMKRPLDFRTLALAGILGILPLKNDLFAQEKKDTLIEKISENVYQNLDSANYSKTINKNKINLFVENARKYLGIEYEWGGRMTKEHPGLDCLGLLFIAHSETFGTKWYNFSVYPSEIVRKKQLGEPVKGLDGILAQYADTSKLEKGDIIYLLSTIEINDKPLAKIEEIKYRCYHMGIYSNKEKNLFLHSLGDVHETDFTEILHDADAIYVTRIKNNQSLGGEITNK